VMFKIVSSKHLAFFHTTDSFYAKIGS
jgi:hypothetical protein